MLVAILCESLEWLQISLIWSSWSGCRVSLIYPSRSMRRSLGLLRLMLVRSGGGCSVFVSGGINLLSVMWDMRLQSVSFWGIDGYFYCREHSHVLDTVASHDSRWCTGRDSTECKFFFKRNWHQRGILNIPLLVLNLTWVLFLSRRYILKGP